MLSNLLKNGEKYIEKCNFYITYFDKIKCYADRPYLVFFRAETQVYFFWPYVCIASLIINNSCIIVFTAIHLYQGQFLLSIFSMDLFNPGLLPRNLQIYIGLLLIVWNPIPLFLAELTNIDSRYPLFCMRVCTFLNSVWVVYIYSLNFHWF